MQFIDLQAQYQHLKIKIDARIQAVLNHGQYIMGPEVQELEEKLAEYVGVKHAITCANGTDALTLALMAMDVKEGDAVFAPTFTFFATAEVIALAKSTPVFVDSDARTFNICPMELEKKIQQTIAAGELTPKAIIAVDLFGLTANYQAIEKIAKKYNLLLIEDAAQGFGGEMKGRRAGSFGDIATTSFFPAKPLGCYGDGGAIFTNNDELAGIIQSLRIHGKGRDKYDNVRIGLNSRLDTIQAAILLEKLDVFQSEIEARQRAANVYSHALEGMLQIPTVPKDSKSAWAQYSVVANSGQERELLMARLKDAGIPSTIYYAKPLHLQGAFKGLRYRHGDLPVSEQISNQIFSLPMHPYLKIEEQRYLIEVLAP